MKLLVGDVAPGAADRDVVRLATTEGRILVTNDKDFGGLAFRESCATSGILLLRPSCEDGLGKAQRVAAVLPSLAARLPGHFAVLTDRGARLRPLRSRESEGSA